MKWIDKVASFGKDFAGGSASVALMLTMFAVIGFTGYGLYQIPSLFKADPPIVFTIDQGRIIQEYATPHKTHDKQGNFTGWYWTMPINTPEEVETIRTMVKLYDGDGEKTYPNTEEVK